MNIRGASGSVFLIGMLLVIGTGCRRPAAFSPIPTGGITSAVVSCELDLNPVGPFHPVCSLIRCQCDALATGNCHGPADPDLCRAEIAAAVEATSRASPCEPKPTAEECQQDISICSEHWLACNEALRVAIEAAQSSGHCVIQRNAAACREEIANAVDACPVVGQITPDRPNPNDIDLADFDRLCATFDRQPCRLNVPGEFCFGEPLEGDALNARLNEVCTDIAFFLDNTFSALNEAYPCDTVSVRNATLVRAGGKSECNGQCPRITCTNENLDRCTVVNLPPATGGHCHVDYVSPQPLCRAPDSDPPELASGGFLAESRSRRSRGELFGEHSRVDFELDGRSGSSTVIGEVDFLGETCVDCPVSFRASLSIGSIEVNGVHFTDITMNAGTGTTPIIPLVGGIGYVPVGTLSGTLQMNVDGTPGYLTAFASGVLAVYLDRSTRIFQLFGEISFQGDDGKLTAFVSVVGLLSNQPPTAEAGPDVVLGCISPEATPVSLHGVARDPDSNVFQAGWYRRTGSTTPDGVLLQPWLDVTTTAVLGANEFRFMVGDLNLQQHADDVTVTVVNHDPIASAGSAQVIECDTHQGGRITLDGSASRDSDGSALTFVWSENGLPIATGPTPAIILPLGHHTIQLEVVDGCGGRATAETHVEVKDTTPPKIVSFANASPVCLWPPNHSLVVLRVGREVSATLEDACDPTPKLIAASASSDQPDNGKGDGNTTGDLRLFDDRLCVRSERQGNDTTGRDYTIAFVAVDSSGNTADPSIVIRVPHDKSGKGCGSKIDSLEVVADDDPACNATPSVSSPATGAESEQSSGVQPNPAARSAATAQGCSATRPADAALALMVVILLACLRRRRGILAAMTLFAGCARAPIGDTTIVRFAGKIEQQAFASSHAVARRLPSGRGIALDVADFAIDCETHLSKAPPKGRVMTITLAGDATDVGYHSLSKDVVGGKVLASITTLEAGPGPGKARWPRTVIVNQGHVSVEQISAAGVRGSAQIASTSGNVSLDGEFEVPFCK